MAGVVPVAAELPEGSHEGHYLHVEGWQIGFDLKDNVIRKLRAC